jgi:hypothetical protein
LIPLLLYLALATPSGAAVVDVTTYGATPNDSIDDSFAIQNAIDEAPSNSTIYFPQGTYLLSGVTINNRSGLTLTGDGSTLTILKRHGSYPNMFESTGSADIVVTRLAFDANGVIAYGGFFFYQAKRITITKNHFFDSNKQPVGEYDRYSWVFGRGAAPSEDIVVLDNLIEDLQLEVDHALRVRIEGNTVARPVSTAGIGVFTINDNSMAQDYTIRNNTIVDPVGAGGIVVHLDPPSSNYCTMKGFRILENHIVYTRFIWRSHASAIRFGTGANSQATSGNVFDDIAIQDNVIYKDRGGSYDFGAVDAIIFGNSSPIANFRFDNTSVTNNRIYYNGSFWIPNVSIREQGIGYVENNNERYTISSDSMPPSVPTALTATRISSKQIHLAWNKSLDNVRVKKYVIYRNGVKHRSSIGTSFIDKGLRPGFSYTYTVVAIDWRGLPSKHSYSITAVTTSVQTSVVKAELDNRSGN